VKKDHSWDSERWVPGMPKQHHHYTVHIKNGKRKEEGAPWCERKAPVEWKLQTHVKKHDKGPREIVSKWQKA